MSGKYDRYGNQRYVSWRDRQADRDELGYSGLSGRCHSKSGCARAMNCPYGRNPPNLDDCDYYADL